MLPISLFLTVVLGVVLSSNGISAQACACSKEYKPFCGTDEKTYGNKCELECAQRYNQNLKVKFEGVCAVPYQPEKGGSQNNWNQIQGSSSNYNPNYVQPPRDFNFNPTQRPGYYAGQSGTIRPNSNYFQQTNGNQKYTQSGQQTYPYQGYQPPRQQYYQPTKQTYTTIPPRPYYPTNQAYAKTIPPKQYYPQTYTTERPVQTYYPTPRQTYYQPRPTTKPFYPAKQGDQNWVPAFGGGFQDE